ncbi:hypothetical protein NHX12_025088 [Muraenolepis orangiensis]|uniref:Protein S-acyltransferase n=1 Tax=Muraenolepis orangiensis TaxID=630683 RepID=A0A9Q0IRX9_9TELE|nr:hypothetical protein NHX12_025088 [Muraenolepis orangiensis]
MRLSGGRWTWKLSRAMRLVLRWCRSCRRGVCGKGGGGRVETNNNRGPGGAVAELWSYVKLLLRSLYYNSLTNSDTALDCVFEPVYWIVDNVTRWFGVVFVSLVVLLTSSVVVIVYLCLLPFIASTYSFPWLLWHLCCGHWLLVMVVFHYYKATTTHPGCPPKELFKPTPPPFTFKETTSHKAIVFLWVLTSSVAVALGGLTLWHGILIGRGETSVERHINNKEIRRLKERGKVFRNPFHHGGINNWKTMLGVEKPSHWVTRVLLPSSHPPTGDGLTWESAYARRDPMAI